MVCADQAHLNVEEVHRLRGQARVRRSGAAVVSPAEQEAEETHTHLDGEEVYDIDEHNNVVREDSGPATHPHVPISGSKRLRAQFGRRRTHGEQLAVGPCGMIFGRGTMFGAEGVYSVTVSPVFSFPTTLKLTRKPVAVPQGAI